MRRTRAIRLLLPCLLALNATYACGGTSIDQQEPASDVGGAGGAVGSPVTIGVGGVSSDATPVGMSTSAGGAIAGPFGCPATLPKQNDVCALPANGPGYCKYDPSACGEPTIASCNAVGRWVIQLPANDCVIGIGGSPGDLPMPLGCPSLQPVSGTHCDIPQGIVSYQCMFSSDCSEVFMTCDQHRTWFVSAEYGGCAGAAGIGGFDF